MSNHKIIVLLISPLFTLLWLNTASAALAPQHNTDRKLGEMYDAKTARESAQDVVTLRIDNVVMKSGGGDGCPQIDSYTVDATVVTVERGSLNKDDAIQLSYRSKYYLCPGPQTRNPRALQRDEIYSAYLQCQNNRCILAGGSWSFRDAEEFDGEFSSLRQEQEYWVEKYGDIRRTFYTEPDAKGTAFELERDDGTWLNDVCDNNPQCLARKAQKGELLVLDVSLPDSHGTLRGDPLYSGCKDTQAKSLYLYRVGRAPNPFCEFADGSLTNVKMLNYYLRDYVNRLDNKLLTSQCLHLDPPTATREDMAGYYGPLNNTVTLACLSYVGHITMNDEEIYLIRDDVGTIHRLRGGDHMGERGGIIKYSSTAEELELYQYVDIAGKNEIVHITLQRDQ